MEFEKERVKMKKRIFIISLLLATAITINAQETDFPKLTGPYLGQKPPGETPELFAPGIISVDENFEHSAAVFSPDGKEVFWCTNVNGNTDKRVAGNLRLYTMKMVDGHWTAPRPAPFVKNIRVERPVFSADGSWADRIELPFYCGGFFAFSPDEKYLFFMNEGIWWVSTSVFDKLKPNNLK